MPSEQGHDSLTERVFERAAQIKAGIEEVRASKERVAETLGHVREWVRGSGPRPARPLLGRLPLKRRLPQSAHALIDYAAAALSLTPVFFSRSVRAQVTSALLAPVGALMAALSDQKLAAAKLIPIEAHEVHDYLWGASHVLAPVLTGYLRRDPLAAAIHLSTGLVVLGSALVTDYCAARGVGPSSWSPAVAGAAPGSVSSGVEPGTA